ncbi:MAG: uroporphyrinogen decarboxylase family protein [Planctomycetota bacterium]|jgi:uroporphyrinogen decarboxylase
MTKREVVKAALNFQKPPYVPWNYGFTLEAKEKLINHYGEENLEDIFQNHFLSIAALASTFTDLGNDCFQDPFGVIWDRSKDKDIGIIKGCVIQEPSLKNYTFPDLTDKTMYEAIPAKFENDKDKFRIFAIGFSLYERAWTLRGMENLLMDFYENPGFVEEFFNAIADHNIAKLTEALKYDFDAVYFGDDWGQQHGLIMGPDLWRKFIKPVLKRMYGVVKDAGKYVMIHSCGDVDEVFDDLTEVGLDCFNPFQPEVMDTKELMKTYQNRLSFHGGMSTQQTLPYGSVDDVINETRDLLKRGENGGYIFSPAHSVEGDVPLENMIAFIETLKEQPGFEG